MEGVYYLDEHGHPALLEPDEPYKTFSNRTTYELFHLLDWETVSPEGMTNASALGAEVEERLASDDRTFEVRLALHWIEHGVIDWNCIYEKWQNKRALQVLLAQKEAEQRNLVKRPK